MAKQTIVYSAEQIAYAREIINSVRLPPMQPPRKNKVWKMRGVDFYGSRYPKVLQENLRKFQEFYERLPVHPMQCETLNEKLFWSKFYTPQIMPTAADKLTVGRFIPEHLQDKVRPAKVHWVSDRPNFPANVRGADGSYFLKANNSWRTTRRIGFPISAEEMSELRKLGADWLARTNFNLWGGEWWYSAIEPKLYIEEDITEGNESCLEYKIQCVAGEVVCIFKEHYVSGTGQRQYDGVGIFDKNFNWVEGVEIGELKNERTDPPIDAKLILDVAKEISKPFDAIRVDLYNPKPGTIILGELTICDAAGFAEFEPRAFDRKLGSSWDFTQYFE